MPPTLFSLFHYHTQQTPDFKIGTQPVTLDHIKAHIQNQTSRSLVHNQLHSQFKQLLESVRNQSPNHYEEAFSSVQELGRVIEQLFEKNKDL